jgi:hypothetical protein
MNFDSASKQCQSLNASLPIVYNKPTSDALAHYSSKSPKEMLITLFYHLKQQVGNVKVLKFAQSAYLISINGILFFLYLKAGCVKTFLKYPDQNCSPPTNWTRKGSTFYYSMTSLTYSFEEALTVCRSHGAQLPKMTNKEELNDVISQMSMSFSTQIKTNLNYFISSLIILNKITNNLINFGISNTI